MNNDLVSISNCLSSIFSICQSIIVGFYSSTIIFRLLCTTPLLYAFVKFWNVVKDKFFLSNYNGG